MGFLKIVLNIEYSSSRYSVREGILIYNQHDLKMIWARLTALLVVVFITVPLIVFSFVNLLHHIHQQQQHGARFKATSMAFVYYGLLLLSVRIFFGYSRLLVN